MTGYSSEMPLAPRMVRAVRQISSASRTLLSLPRLTCSGRRVPASFMRPRWIASRMPLLSSRYMSASFFWVSWKPAIGLPNCTRSWEYRTAVSNEERAAPMAPQTMPKRASFRQDSGPFSPRTWGSTASAGRRTWSMTSSLVTEARSESLCLIADAEKPGELVGTTKPRMPSSVCAQTTATWATEPLVIHILLPLSTQSPPSRLAVVRAAGVRAVVGLGQSEAADGLAGGHARQPLLLLLFAAPAPDGEHGQRALHGDQRAHSGVGGLQLEAGQAVVGRAHPRTAVALKVHPQQAERAELSCQAMDVGDLTGFEPLGDIRVDAPGAELAHGRADRNLVLGQ